jgi:hypothetical protein
MSYFSGARIAQSLSQSLCYPGHIELVDIVVHIDLCQFLALSRQVNLNTDPPDNTQNFSVTASGRADAR